MGNNEFMGKDDKKERGWKGKMRCGLSRAANNLMVYKVLSGFIIRNLGDPPESRPFDSSQDIMGRVERFREIATSKNWDSLARQEVHSRYKSNLLDMVGRAKQRGVGIVLCTLAVNLKDYPPFNPGDDYWLQEKCMQDADDNTRIYQAALPKNSAPESQKNATDHKGTPEAAAAEDLFKYYKG